MTPDALVCPWSQTPLPARRPAAPVSFAVLAVADGGRARGGLRAGDALACPWSSTALPAVTPRPVAALPVLAPALPAPRAATGSLRPVRA